MTVSRRSCVRCLVLTGNSLLCFGTFYLYDTVISLQPFLIGTPCDEDTFEYSPRNCCLSCLGFNPLEYNILVGLPLAISALTSLVAGFLVDRFGYRLITVISTLLVILGAVIRALGARKDNGHTLSYYLMLTGGLLVDNAFSVVCIIRLYVSGRWFSGRHLGSVVGFLLGTSLSGSVLAYYINPLLIEAIGLEKTLWCAIPIGGISFIAAILLSICEKVAEGKDYGTIEKQKSSSVSLMVFFDLNGRFWLICTIIAIAWTLLYAFMGNSVAYQTDIYRLPYELASFSTGVMYITKIVASPIVGVLSARLSKRGPFAFIGCLCYVSAMTMLFLAIEPPIVIIVLVGLGFATLYTVMAAILTEAVSYDKLCTANGIMNAIMCLAIGAGDIAVGAITESHSDRVQGWLQSGVFLLALAIVETVLVVFFLVKDALSASREKCYGKHKYRPLTSEAVDGERHHLKERHLRTKSFGTIP